MSHRRHKDRSNRLDRHAHVPLHRRLRPIKRLMASRVETDQKLGKLRLKKLLGKATQVAWHRFFETHVSIQGITRKTGVKREHWRRLPAEKRWRGPGRYIWP